MHFEVSAYTLTTSKSEQNGWHFADSVFKLLIENDCILITMKFAEGLIWQQVRIDSNDGLVMNRLQSEPISEPMANQVLLHHMSSPGLNKLNVFGYEWNIYMISNLLMNNMYIYHTWLLPMHFNPNEVEDLISFWYEVRLNVNAIIIFSMVTMVTAHDPMAVTSISLPALYDRQVMKPSSWLRSP